MSKPMSSDRPVVDITTVMPTQRIVSDEVAAGRADAGPDPEAPLVDLDGVAARMPDLSAVLAGVPGGLGAEVCEAFTFAGQHWTAADARVNGTPIGLQLAMEQRGLDTSGDHAADYEVPLRRTGT